MIFREQRKDKETRLKCKHKYEIVYSKGWFGSTRFSLVCLKCAKIYDENYI